MMYFTNQSFEKSLLQISKEVIKGENMKNMYVLYDKVAEEYWPPISVKNDRTAIRGVLQRLMESNQKPQEFELRLVATFDPETGEIILLETKLIELKYEIPE